MSILIFFVVACIAIVAMILKFEKKQVVKVNAVLKETRGVPPLLLLKSTEQKISILKAALRYDDVPQNMAAAAINNVYSTEDEQNRQSKVKEFKLLSARYNDGQMSLEAYNIKLDELLDHVQSHRGDFVLAT